MGFSPPHTTLNDRSAEVDCRWGSTKGFRRVQHFCCDDYAMNTLGHVVGVGWRGRGTSWSCLEKEVNAGGGGGGK